MEDTYTTSTQTFVVYCSCLSPVNLDHAYLKAQDFEVTGGEILSIKYGQKDKTSNYLKCLTLSLRFGEKSPPDPVSIPSRRGRKVTRIKISGKVLSVKLFRNGSTQITGCKSIDHVKFSMNLVFTLLGVDRIHEMNIVSIMNNVNFSVGFKVDREKLGKYLVEHGINVPPITTGYMGVKIRIPSLVGKHELTIPKMSWSRHEGFEEIQPIPYLDFFAHDIKKIEKPLTVCVGIFQNGKILMTCIDDFTTRRMYNYIFEMLTDARPYIEIHERAVKTFRR